MTKKLAVVRLTFPDGSESEFEKGIAVSEVIAKLKPENAKKILVARLDGILVDLSKKIENNCRIEFIAFDSRQGKEVYWHSCAHVMANAITNIFPNALLTIGPVVDTGFYYDMDHAPFNPEDLKKIEKEMNRIISRNIPFTRKEVSKSEAIGIFQKNPFKIELINEFNEGLTVYSQEGFADLCRGPHVPSSGYIKAFKLTKIAGAYWRGDAKNKQLQRIYGVAFPDEKLLNEYVNMLAEAEKRDHRKIGKDLDLFSIHEEGPGFIFWHPKGMVVRNSLLDFWRELHRKHGYSEISTPIILNCKLWVQSGHMANYKDNMYFTKIDEQDFAIKPMNCPGGILVYREKLHSYRELPLRIGEIGTVHRHELSGVLAGLFRVRCFTQDDAHIYMTPEQIKEEIIGVISLTNEVYTKFGFTYNVELSTRPAKSMGTDEQWNTAENALKEAMDSRGIQYKINPGDGAFYGPKIDFHLKDCIGRTWQCGTIQLDMANPERFDLTYEGSDGKKHRPVMIHRTVYGSLERFIGILTEHYAGKFPLWLNPVQVRILTVADRFEPYAKGIYEKYFNAGLRAELDVRPESISYKVREAQLNKINYILVVGEREAGNNTVTVRTRDNKIIGEIDSEEFLGRLLEEIKERR